MSDLSASDLPSYNSAAVKNADADSKFKISRARVDISTDAEDEHGPSSPHFYSTSVRKSLPTLDSYISDIENSAPDNNQDFDIDGTPTEDVASEQQVHEQAVRLDLLRRQHSARARQTLEQLQNTATSTAGSDSPRGGSSETRRTNSGVSVDMVRQQSEQLKQASGDLKRLAEEQRTLAEEAVANFLLQEDLMMGEADEAAEQQAPADAGLSQALHDVFEDRHGASRTSLTRQLEKIRRAEQVIKDAEADEQIADQLAALQLTLSQLAEQEAAGGGGNLTEDSNDGQHPAASEAKAPGGLPQGRHLLKDISENSQEGLDSSLGHSSSSHHSHMAASAFAAVSQVNGFHGDDQPNQDDQPDDPKLSAAELAQADEQTAEHAQGQATSPDVGKSKCGANADKAPTSSGPDEAQPHTDTSSDAQSTPLTAASLNALASTTEESQHSVADDVAKPNQAQPSGPIADGLESDRAGSTAGSQTFDSELHDSVAALVQAPGNTDYSAPQPEDPPIGAAGPTVDALILQSLSGDVTSPVSGASSQNFDAALQAGVSAAVTSDAAAVPDGTSMVPDSVVPLDTSSSSGLETTGSSQGAVGGSGVVGSVTRAGADSPAQEATSAADPAAVEVDDIPLYTLGSDDEDDLTVVSSKDQARDAQAAANDFMQNSRPTTPDDPASQKSVSESPALLPPPPGARQPEGASVAATDTAQPFTTDYLEEGRMADAFEPEEFKGMLFHDGVDSQGRPVIVVNTDAVGTTRKARAQALQYMLHRLEPIVTQGPYVLVMVATGQHQKSNKLPAMWLISAYRNLSRPFRKNVRYILLVRPTGGLKALVACIRPFVSAKAAKKVRKVESLAGISAATSGEVTLQHLGSRFAAAAGDYFLQGAAAQPSTVNPYDMQQF